MQFYLIEFLSCFRYKPQLKPATKANQNQMTADEDDTEMSSFDKQQEEEQQKQKNMPQMNDLKPSTIYAQFQFPSFYDFKKKYFK